MAGLLFRVILDRYDWRYFRTGVIAILLIIFILHLVPLWLITRKMGYPGVFSLLAFIPGVHLIIAYFLALSEWPVLKRSKHTDV